MSITSGQYVDPAVAQQDALRPLRNFINALSNLQNDQTWAGTDYVAVNPTGQFSVQTPYGTSVEGQPSTVASGSLTINPGMLVLAAFALLIYKSAK